MTPNGLRIGANFHTPPGQELRFCGVEFARAKRSCERADNPQTAKHAPQDLTSTSRPSQARSARRNSTYYSPTAGPAIRRHRRHTPVERDRKGMRTSLLLAPGESWTAPSAATEGRAAVAVADAATETPSEPRASQRAAGSYVGVHRCALQSHARSAVAPRGDGPTRRDRHPRQRLEAGVLVEPDLTCQLQGLGARPTCNRKHTGAHVSVCRRG